MREVEEQLLQRNMEHEEALNKLALQHEPLEWARLQLNCANTTRLLKEGRDVALLEDAKRRYDNSRLIFQRELPSAVATVDTALTTLAQQIASLDE